jgi:hypothetical protein
VAGRFRRETAPVIPLAEQIATTWRAIDELCAGRLGQEAQSPIGKATLRDALTPPVMDSWIP